MIPNDTSDVKEIMSLISNFDLDWCSNVMPNFPLKELIEHLPRELDIAKVFSMIEGLEGSFTNTLSSLLPVSGTATTYLSDLIEGQDTSENVIGSGFVSQLIEVVSNGL